MTPLAFWSLLPALFGLLLGGGSGGSDAIVRRMIVREEVIYRVPVRPLPGPVIEWHEKKGPGCLSPQRLVGAALSGPDSIDFVFADRSRFRAKLDETCMGLDFYGGFYFQTEDGRLCARRDVVRARSGGSCRIDKFRRLEARIGR